MFILINLIFILESHLYQIDDSVNSLVRLTPNDTLHFESLSFDEKSIFFQNLTKQLAEIIPIPDNRIIINDYYEKDPTALNQILIPITISNSNDVSAINVSTITNTLNTLIRNKGNTLISKSNLTSMHDESYGLKVKSK